MWIHPTSWMLLIKWSNYIKYLHSSACTLFMLTAIKVLFNRRKCQPPHFLILVWQLNLKKNWVQFKTLKWKIFFWHFIRLSSSKNIYTHPMEGHRKFWEGGGLKGQFCGRGGGSEFKPKKFCDKVMDIFWNNTFLYFVSRISIVLPLRLEDDLP